MKIAIYDMDRTLTRRASWTCWLFFFARTEAPARLLLAPLLLAPMLGFAIGLVDRKGLKEATQRLMMGPRVPRATVERSAARFAARFGAANELRGALASVAADRAAGLEPVLATASCRYYGKALAARWGIEQIIATENVWDGDALTPRIRGENCYEMGKLRMILASLSERPRHVKFVSDDVSDLAVLMWADEPVAANPSGPLRRVAGWRGWPVFDWT